MDENSFFKALEQQYSNKLPFVVYSRPVNSIIRCWLQNDATLYTSESFTESGFVFAPFDINASSVLLPESHCVQHSIDVNQLETTINNPRLGEDKTNKLEHINLVKKGIKCIQQGELKKVVLSRREINEFDSNNPLNVFKRLYNTYKNAMVYCWYHPKVGLWLGATPELLFKLEGKQLTTVSLAGTQPFTGNSINNWTKKEVEEQQIVTDYISKQIKPFTKKFSVTKAETIKAGNLAHLKSRITSIIDNSTSIKAVIDALHPTPAVCGFPKNLAKEFILDNELYNREYYTGFLGELNLPIIKSRNTNRRNVENNAYTITKNCSTLYVNLRCVQLKNKKALIYVGGGITKDSNPANEWEETVNKTKTIVNVLS